MCPGVTFTDGNETRISFPEFANTPKQTADLLRRYIKCMQNKLVLFTHQVSDFCEKVNSEESTRVAFSDDDSLTSLHYCLDKFLMSVLKNFLQSVDEGFADLIDELEDHCVDDQKLSLTFKRLVFEFQQAHFEKREKMAREFEGEQGEKGKSSYAWFDNFFGDVTSLLKNPISREMYKAEMNKEEEMEMDMPPPKPIATQLFGSKQALRAGISAGSTHLTQSNNFANEAGNMETPNTLGRIEYSDTDSPKRAYSPEKEDGHWGGQLLECQSQGPQSEVSYDPTWNLQFSQDNESGLLSSNKSSSPLQQPRPKKRSLDFKTDSPTFEEVFSFESFNVDDSIIYALYVESPSSLLVGTDNRRLYRYRTNDKTKEVLFDNDHYIYDIKKDFLGRIAFADSDNIYILSGEDQLQISLGSYSSCTYFANPRRLRPLHPTKPNPGQALLPEEQVPVQGRRGGRSDHPILQQADDRVHPWRH
jgi:hypothetical protein